MATSNKPSSYVLPLFFSAVVIIIGIVGIAHGERFAGALSLLLGSLGLAGVWQSHKGSSRTDDVTYGRGMIVRMAVSWLGVGIATLFVGILSGGLLLLLGGVAFILSLYLFFGMLIAARRRRP